ncbi:D-galactonate transporter [Brevibacterium sanguinis]|uniref:D-galactonate transporter n=2 Tax=Brevibacterium TaxID=1696 RepID=A0A366ILW6_9MICO|nr:MULTISPECIES: MFS transporter [Brevibacterium]RBP67196.1 D-galactonate transporter [Brevibacterium sanguinis]RBP73721.1 D-galactonate transporter [Brevibacterium celere]
MSSEANPSAPGQTPDAALEKRTLKKVTLRLIPFIIVMYFINYLDRTNLGIAGPGGMNEELGLSATQFGFAAGVFFFGYLLLEVPSNLALHRFGARKWLARILVSWGLVAALMAFVPNAGWLYVLRFLLGVAEAGFFPGIILYLTYWFPSSTRARATALFMLAIPMSSVIGTPLSSWIIAGGNEMFENFSGWRFMFLVEGLPAVVLGIICLFFLTDRPRDAKWLDPEEREWLQNRMDAEESRKSETFHYPIRRALLQPRVLALSFVYFGMVYGLYALSFFLPTIIAGFKESFGTEFSIVQVGLITAIPWVFGAATMYFWSRHGDRTNERVWHVALPLFVGGVSIPIALYLNSPFTTMIAVTITCMAICAALPTFWPLPQTFLAGAGAAAGLALINSLGNSAGFFAPYITGWLAELTGTQNAGMWVVGATMVAAGIVTLILKGAPAPDHVDAATDR